MRKTVLVVAGYAPVADWMARCLEGEGYLTVSAKDTDEAFRLASLIEVDLVIAWPTVSGFAEDGFLSAAGGCPSLQVPFLVATFRESLGSPNPMGGWLRAPLAADRFIEQVHEAMGHAALPRQPSVEPEHGQSRPLARARCRRPRPSALVLQCEGATMDGRIKTLRLGAMNQGTQRHGKNRKGQANLAAP